MKRKIILIVMIAFAALTVAFILYKRLAVPFSSLKLLQGDTPTVPKALNDTTQEVPYSSAELVNWMRTASGWSELRNSNYVTAILPERDVVWFGTSGGIRYFKKNEGKWGLLTRKDGLPSAVVNDISGEGRWLWAATNDGLVRIDKKNLTIKIYTVDDGLKTNSVLNIKADSTGVWLLYGRIQDLWLTGPSQSGSDEISYLNIADGNIKNYQVLGNQASRIEKVGDELWVIAYGQIIRLQPSTGKRRTIYQDSVPELETIDLSKVSSISIHGRFVLLSAPNLSRGKSELLAYDRRTGEWLELEEWYVSTMVSAGGLFWVGASYDILSASDFVVKYIKDFESEWKDVLYFRNGMLTALAPDSEGVWIGTSNCLIYCSMKKKTIDTYRFEPDIKTWNMMDNGFRLLKSSRYGLIIVRDSEIVLFDTERGVYKTLTDLYGVSDICVKDSFAFCSIAGDEYYVDRPYIYQLKIDTINSTARNIIESEDLENAPYNIENENGENWSYRIAVDSTGLWVGRGWLTKVQDTGKDTVVHGLFRYDYNKQIWTPVESGVWGLKSDYIRGLVNVSDDLWLVTDEALYRRGRKGWQRMLDGGEISLLSSNRSFFVIHDGKIKKFIGEDKGWKNVCSLSVVQERPEAILEMPSGNTIIGGGNGLWLIANDGRGKMIHHGSITSLVEHHGKHWAIISEDLFQLMEKGDSLLIIRPAARQVCKHEVYRFEKGKIPEFSSSQ